jgi:hypothetical protein
LGVDTLYAGIGNLKKTIPINILEYCPDCINAPRIQPEFKIYNRNREVRENYEFDISKDNPRIVFVLNANKNITKGRNVKEISVSFSIPNILFRCDKSTIRLLDLPST